MLLRTRGIPHLIQEPLVGRVTRNALSTDRKSILISEDNLLISNSTSFLAIITNLKKTEPKPQLPSVYEVKTLNHLCEGDIVVINPSGTINTLYRVNSHQNFLLATERCNSNCLMCSQPPKDRDDIPYHFFVYKQLIPLIPKECVELGITGGEPTLMGESFLELLALLKEELPNTEIHCLTNGRTFAWSNMARKLGNMNFQKLMLGIPVYADYYQLHDYIVQAQGAFNQTILGLHNLAENHQRIEIRVVLHKLSIPRLTRLAIFIYKNFPFVDHVAFMGLENQGYTPHNIDKLWIDPHDYMGELHEAVYYLSSRGINVSIYNSQLCVMPQELWKFSKKSISDWKNIYLEECQKCTLIEQCGGLFASCEQMHSSHLKAFEETQMLSFND